MNIDEDTQDEDVPSYRKDKTMLRDRDGEPRPIGAGFGISLGTIGSLLVICLLGGAMYGCPQYNVYKSRLDGEAELAQAEYSKRVVVQTAQAKKDSAQFEADAEVIRAGGVARANEIIGNSLKDNEAYLRYLWITDLAGNNRSPSVIYVPTETNLPILEATRHLVPPAPPAK
jgi:hypothetical protein